MKLTIVTAVCLCAALSVANHAQAADTPEPTREAAPSRAADPLSQVRALVAAKQWAAAIDTLRRSNDTRSADWNNLMGYSLRKGQSPDLAASETYYEAALRIDPKHRNALAYSGELFLMKGELDRAEARLAALAAVCGGACEQHAELKAAIERYRSAGNKFVPAW